MIRYIPSIALQYSRFTLSSTLFSRFLRQTLFWKVSETRKLQEMITHPASVNKLSIVIQIESRYLRFVVPNAINLLIKTLLYFILNDFL